MIELTEEEFQKKIDDARQKQAALEQWTIAEDTLRRLLKVTVEQQIAAGILHPFHRDVATTMYSNAIVGRNFPQQQEPQDEAPKQV